MPKQSARCLISKASWSHSIVEVDQGGSIVNYNNDKSTVFDLTSPREWLEYVELTSEGQEGAYTVLRCDVDIHHSSRPDDDDDNHGNKICRAHIWGKDFHMKRLVDSYRAVVLQQLKDDTCVNNTATTTTTDDDQQQQVVTEEYTTAAIDETNTILDHLVHQATRELLKQEATQTTTTQPNDDNDDILSSYSSNNVFVIMLTILWQPPPPPVQRRRSSDYDNDAANSAIVVRGHACCFSSGRRQSQPTTRQQQEGLSSLSLPPPITVMVAPDKDKLPNRYNHLPEAKLSSWCRRRRPLEEQFKLLGEDVEEVLLTKRVVVNGNGNGNDNNDNDDWELLEGLTSNVFVVYEANDGTRIGVVTTAATPHENVLKGYGRQLVLDCASKLGLLCYHGDDDDITASSSSSILRLQNAGQWKEVFLTSSMKLVVPVRKVLIQTNDENENDNNNNCFRTLWSSSAGRACDDQHEEFPICQLLYREVLKTTKHDL